MKRITSVLIASFALLTFVGVGPLTSEPALADVKPNSTIEEQKSAATELVDINSASLKELRTLPGIGKVYSKKIIDGRPYKAVEELRTRKVLPTGAYAKIQDRIVANTK